ncbi:MAG: cytidine deaminase [candidate division WOR-3 bacterium]|jgi:cytidine deaminase
MNRQERMRLLKAAKRAQARAYAPYSGFQVGAAVLTARGRIYAGANVENSSYGLTICAERVAIFKAVNAGERQIVALVVYTQTKGFTPACGACLQVLSEFGKNPVVVLAGQNGTREFRLRELLRFGFRLAPVQPIRSRPCR